jgi:sugar phosphate isomerase/epimerase
MNRPLAKLAVRLLLTAAVGQISLVAGASADTAKPAGLSNRFFAYSVRVPQEKLRDLGFTPTRTLYLGIKLDEDPVYAPEVEQRIRKAAGTDAVVWFTVLGNRKKEENEAKAVAALQKLADVAAEADLEASIYPHAGFYAATAREAVRLVEKADRKNLGVTLNLCHELMAGNADEMPQIIDEVAPYLTVVTINGADHKKKGEKMGWDRLIQPLGQGDFDVYGHLERLESVGFDGPVGLQCYGLKGEPVEHLKQSMKAWKQYSARLASPPGEDQ